MKKFIAVCMFSALLNSGAARAQSAPPEHAAPPADAAYLALVDKAMLDPASVNWAELRKLYAKSSFYSDFKKETVRSAFDFAAKSAAAAPMMRSGFKDLQRQQYANFNSHLWAMKVSKELPSEAISIDGEKKALEAIADSIVENADGSSAAKAYAVVLPDEENFVVEVFLQQKIAATTPTEVGGHKFDIVTYNDLAKGPVKLFFNTDLVPPKPPQ